jgi:hypothetical protein
VRPAVRAILAITCVASHRSALAQRMMFPDDSSTAHRFRSMTLAIDVAPDHIAVGDTLRVTFHLANASATNVTLCIGRGYGVELATPFDTLRPALFADQESCDGERQTLIPGFSITWDRYVVVSELRSGGSASLTAWADILDPLDCQVYGCGRAVMRAPGVAVQVVAARSR